jgi:hypothetical protein
VNIVADHKPEFRASPVTRDHCWDLPDASHEASSMSAWTRDIRKLFCLTSASAGSESISPVIFSGSMAPPAQPNGRKANVCLIHAESRGASGDGALIEELCHLQQCPIV